MNANVQTPAGALQQRVAALVAHFVHVQHARMQGLMLLNPALEVAAVGFDGVSRVPDAPAWAEGVLITPWFMNLVRLPQAHQAHGDQVARSFLRDFGCERFAFIGAHNPDVGYHETCALFSPMDGFTNQALALETAQAALALTRSPEAAAPPVVNAPSSRRAFFLGRPSGRGMPT